MPAHRIFGAPGCFVAQTEVHLNESLAERVAGSWLVGAAGILVLSSLGYAGVQRRRRTPVEQQGIDARDEFFSDQPPDRAPDDWPNDDEQDPAQQAIDELCDQLFQSESDEASRLDEAFARFETDAPGPDLMALGTAPGIETAPRMNTRSSASASSWASGTSAEPRCGSSRCG